MQMKSKRRTERKQSLSLIFSGRHCSVLCWNKDSTNNFRFLKPMVHQNYFSEGTQNKKVAAYREEKVIPKHQTAKTTMLLIHYLNNTEKIGI